MHFKSNKFRLVFLVLLTATGNSRAQELINPNNLPPCPRDQSAIKYHCWGKFMTPRGDTYIGELKGGKQNGLGTYTYVDGSRYVGQWTDGKLQGKGELSWTAGPNKGDKYTGDFHDNKRHGFGVHLFASGARYVGEFFEDKKHGSGTLNFPDGSRYVGDFRNDVKSGQGTLTYPQGYGYAGEWENDRPHGKGIETYLDGKASSIGKFEMGKFIKTEPMDLPSAETSTEDEPAKLIGKNDTRKLVEQKRHDASKAKKISLEIMKTEPDKDGVFTIDIRTNSDTASLTIDGEELGGRPDGSYSIRRIARVGQDTTVSITGVDVNGNSDTKVISVKRNLNSNQVKYGQLIVLNIKQKRPRDAVAIIIGIEKYKRIQKADFARADAQVFYDYARRAMGIKDENIKILLDENADDIDILQAFQSWLPLKVQKGQTEVIVFFSGHGYPSEDGRGVYFLPYGVDKNYLDRTAVKQNEIVAALQAAKAKSVTMIVDSCYSGSSRAGSPLISGAKPISFRQQDTAYPEEFFVLTASAFDQISWASPELQHGIFSFYLMKGMEGNADKDQDGKITLGEMQEFLTEMVGRQALSLNRKQQPQVFGSPTKVLVGE
jgi:hypothetical protein